jgi:hypothetical protein
MKADLHIHTKYSFDSLLEPKTVIKFALKHGLSAIGITDHNTIKGSLVAKREWARVSSCKDLIIVSGTEVKTDMGDVIGLFIQDEIKARQLHTVIEEVRRQGGLVVLPHPYNGHGGVVDEFINYVDVVEALNGRSSRVNNTKALRLANNFNKPAIACSDSHFSFEIGRVKTAFHSDLSSTEELRKLILNGKKEFIGKESSFLVHGFSFVTGVIKQVAGLYRG